MPQARKIPATCSDCLNVWYDFLGLANLYLTFWSVQQEPPPTKANASRHCGTLSFILCVAWAQCWPETLKLDCCFGAMSNSDFLFAATVSECANRTQRQENGETRPTGFCCNFNGCQSVQTKISVCCVVVRLARWRDEKVSIVSQHLTGDVSPCENPRQAYFSCTRHTSV